MFIPLSDDPNFSDKRPWVNYGLIATNVIVWLYFGTSTSPAGYQAFLWEWGFVPGAPRIETYVTSMFMHGGFMHLAGNMLFLWVFGDNVEGRLGHVGYLFAYLTFGLAAVLLYQVLDPTSLIPLVGASGAIFGVCGFYFLAFKDNTVRVLIFFFYIFWPVLRARWVLGAYFVIDFINLVVTESSAAGEGGGVAYAAHVGGFAVGLAMAFVVLRFLPPPKVASRRQHKLGLKSASRSRLRRGADAARSGRYEDAYADFEAVVRMAPSTPIAGEAALNMAMVRAHVLGDVAGAKGLLEYAVEYLVDPALKRRAEDELYKLGRFEDRTSGPRPPPPPARP